MPCLRCQPCERCRAGAGDTPPPGRECPHVGLTGRCPSSVPPRDRQPLHLGRRRTHASSAPAPPRGLCTATTSAVGSALHPRLRTQHGHGLSGSVAGMKEHAGSSPLAARSVMVSNQRPQGHKAPPGASKTACCGVPSVATRSCSPQPAPASLLLARRTSRVEAEGKSFFQRRRRDALAGMSERSAAWHGAARMGRDRVSHDDVCRHCIPGLRSPVVFEHLHSLGGSVPPPWWSCMGATHHSGGALKSCALRRAARW